MRFNPYLNEIEQQKDIKILLACETGSRAWGFPSPDSDFDIRIIYAHKKDWYLSLSEKKDSIEMMFENNDIDVAGWDLRKSLRLLRKSNAPILERLQSPIIYKHDPLFLEGIWSLAESYYSRIATIHHYLSMAKNFRFDLNDESYKLKKFFYALRSVTATRWILEKDTPPPMIFMEMVDGLDLPNHLVKRIKELIQLKSTISESYLHQGEKELIDFIDKCILKAEGERTNLPSSKGNSLELDAFFIKTIST